MATIDPAPVTGEQTPIADQTDARVKGFQRLLSERDGTLSNLQAQLDAANAALAEAQAEMAPFKEKDAAEKAEADALATYNDLKARFESEPPPPIGNHPVRDDWTRPRQPDQTYTGRERTGDSQGWPT